MVDPVLANAFVSICCAIPQLNDSLSLCFILIDHEEYVDTQQQKGPLFNTLELVFFVHRPPMPIYAIPMALYRQILQELRRL
jgi:hypothetical protein